LAKWRAYARAELKDAAADDPEFDFGLLTMEERWQVALALEIRKHIEQGKAGGPCPFLQNRGISDLLHASIVAWQVGRSVFSTEPTERTLLVDEWVTKRLTPRRRRIAHGIRYGFLAGLGGEPAEPAWSSADYIAAYEAAWNVGNALAIDSDPR
jgi:hypothetical protein